MASLSADAASSGSPMLVEVPASGATAGELLAAVDAALGGDAGDVRVRIVTGPDEPQPALAELCAADPRVELVPAGAPAPAGSIRAAMPARARPAAHTLTAIRDLLGTGDAGAIEVAVPGRLGVLARTALAARVPGARKLRAERVGDRGTTTAVAAARVGLGSAGSPFAGPRPLASMAAERAEHLRHRARSATIRARLDRDAQRFTRETMRAEHERARILLLERRLGSTSAPRWIAWRARVARRGAYEGARRVWWVLRAGRSFARRVWRYARDRARQRRSPAPG